MLRVMVGVAAAITGATAGAPSAHADMRYGNYEVLSDRWTTHSWVWAVYPCETPGEADQLPAGCVLVSALPRPQFGAYYGGEATLVDGKYSFTADVPDGLRCPGQALPTRDTYTWDVNTLAGTIESRFEEDCFDGPPGINTWEFSLKRM